MSETGDAVDPLVSLESAGSTAKFINLPTGSGLDFAEAKAVTAAKRTQVIVVAGPPDCGKTTLVTSIYETFQWQAFGNHLFVASQTLPGFERRCFFSRTASGRREPDTARTPLGNAKYLHLGLCPEGSSGNSVDVLFTDVSGESFRHACDSSEECRQLVFLERADHLALLIDGEKLAAPKTRWSAGQDVASLLQAFLDNQMLSASTRVWVLFSKWDFIVRSPDDAAVEIIVGDIEHEFRERFGQRVRELCFARVAARPRNGTLPFAFGVEDMFKTWLIDDPSDQQLDLTPGIMGQRESERFFSRQMAAASHAS